jgi:PAS domain-containing protein
VASEKRGLDWPANAPMSPDTPKDASSHTETLPVRLIDETPFMLTRCSRDLRYLFVSRACAEMLGRTRADIEGKPITEIIGRKRSP